MFTDGSHLNGGATGYVLSGLEDRTILGGRQNPHGVQPRGLRYGMHQSLQGTGIRTRQQAIGRGHGLQVILGRQRVYDPRRKLAPARCMRSRLASTSLHHRRARPTPSPRSGGALYAKESRETRGPMGGPNPRRKSQTPGGSGGGSRIGLERGRCPYPDPWHTFSGRARKSSRPKPVARLQVGYW